jgi:hypothetical protein
VTRAEAPVGNDAIRLPTRWHEHGLTERGEMRRPWEADPSAHLKRRLGKSAAELGQTSGGSGCPDIWELDNGDIAVVGRDLTTAYASRLPQGVSVASDERLVVIPRAMLIAARPDIPDV